MELRRAEKWFGRDPETKKRVEALREQLTALAMEVNDRDPTRQLDW